MKIVIDIPKEFETDVLTKGVFGEENKFVEFFKRVSSGIEFRNNVCGRYELEIADMFAEQFAKLEILNDESTKAEGDDGK